MVAPSLPNPSYHWTYQGFLLAYVDPTQSVVWDGCTIHV